LYGVRAIAASALASLNAYRKSCNCPGFRDDPLLDKIAMKHSRRIASKKIPFGKDTIAQLMAHEPFPFWEARVAECQTSDITLITVVNGWISDRATVALVLGKHDCAGAGYAISEDYVGYLTVIFAIRSHIGTTFYHGETLTSILWAHKCLELLNRTRCEDFQLLPIKIIENLCDSAYRFIDFNKKVLTKAYLEEELGKYSAISVAIGEVPVAGATPEIIVSEWLNQTGKQSTFLGDFNRIGIGVKCHGSLLQSVVLFVRSVPAAIVDGTEKVIEPAIVAGEVINLFNRFRAQHYLDPLETQELLAVTAENHAIFVANGQTGDDPLEDEDYAEAIDSEFDTVDISHFACPEMNLAAQRCMARWRMDATCISILLNDISDIGVGVAFDSNFVCHITILIGSRGEENEVKNRIVRF
jgi:uncharacterized protein YkwD